MEYSMRGSLTSSNACRFTIEAKTPSQRPPIPSHAVKSSQWMCARRWEEKVDARPASTASTACAQKISAAITARQMGFCFMTRKSSRKNGRKKLKKRECSDDPFPAARTDAMHMPVYFLREISG